MPIERRQTPAAIGLMASQASLLSVEVPLERGGVKAASQNKKMMSTLIAETGGKEDQELSVKIVAGDGKKHVRIQSIALPSPVPHDSSSPDSLETQSDDTPDPRLLGLEKDEPRDGFILAVETKPATKFEDVGIGHACRKTPRPKTRSSSERLKNKLVMVHPLSEIEEETGVAGCPICGHTETTRTQLTRGKMARWVSTSSSFHFLSSPEYWPAMR